MLVICDNSTLPALAEIGLIHLLPQVLGHVTIPAAVHREAVHPSAPSALRDWIAHPPVWLTVEPDPTCLLEETKCLGPGEAAAITIAWHHRGTSGLIIDEKRGSGSLFPPDCSRHVGALPRADMSARKKRCPVPRAPAFPFINPKSHLPPRPLRAPFAPPLRPLCDLRGSLSTDLQRSTEEVRCSMFEVLPTRQFLLLLPSGVVVICHVRTRRYHC